MYMYTHTNKHIEPHRKRALYIYRQVSREWWSQGRQWAVWSPSSCTEEVLLQPPICPGRCI